MKNRWNIKIHLQFEKCGHISIGSRDDTATEIIIIKLTAKWSEKLSNINDMKHQFN